MEKPTIKTTSRKMSKIVIEGKEIDARPDETLLQTCEAAGAEIPRFCLGQRTALQLDRSA
ncbi:MAG TPA: 2Fe-2S iron-sulfur cluster-binding protein [Rhodoplanes sp.]|nr:2Fe-2S iron-sulfur cluster-binding protein [Rhodoplanes sp.]